jgi:hypothetical protein
MSFFQLEQFFEHFFNEWHMGGTLPKRVHISKSAGCPGKDS